LTIASAFGVQSTTCLARTPSSNAVRYPLRARPFALKRSDGDPKAVNQRRAKSNAVTMLQPDFQEAEIVVFPMAPAATVSRFKAM